MKSPTKRIVLIVLLGLFLIVGCSSKRERTVLLQPYGTIDQMLVDEAKKSIENTFGFTVYVANRLEIPKSAFVNIKSPRYRADSILEIQRMSKPDSIDFVVGLTTLDISTTKRDGIGRILKPVSRYGDWGVFGLAYSPGCSAIISTFRLGSSNNRQLIDRLKKVCNHELGHNLGLPHCSSSVSCVLRDAAETIKTVDFVSDKLCQECKSKI